jgi:hypothetical protein
MANLKATIPMSLKTALDAEVTSSCRTDLIEKFSLARRIASAQMAGH